jgi:hypothetical protein
LIVLNDPGFGPPGVLVEIGNPGQPPFDRMPFNSTPATQVRADPFKHTFSAQTTRTYVKITGTTPDRSIPIDAVSVYKRCIFGLSIFCG